MNLKKMLENMLLGGYDSGNTSLKLSYLNKDLNIDSFSISTVIAPAPPAKIELNQNSVGNRSIDVKDIDMLHVTVNSNKLNASEKNQSWFVGVYAKDKKDKIQPKNTGERAEIKFSETNKALHMIPLLTGMAVAAARSKKHKVKVPFSGGMPIEDLKNFGESKILDLLLGTHVITFLDGVYEGITVTITIENGFINAEGSASTLGLEFDIQKGELLENKEVSQSLGSDYGIIDLGAGTEDLAVFENYILNKNSSTNSFIGTNKYIDEILEELKMHPAFEKFRNVNEDFEGPIQTREQLIQQYIAPEVKKLIANPDYEMSFVVNWGFVKNVDVTNIVTSKMKAYGQAVEEEIMKFWMNTGTPTLAIVGGGLLFGYYGLKEFVDSYKDSIILPSNIEDAPFFTSRSYLIANFDEVLDSLETVQ